MNKAITDTPEATASGAKPEWAMSKREKINLERAAEGLKPKRRRWPWVVLALIVVAGGGGYVVMNGQKPAEAPVAEAVTEDPVMQVNAMEFAVMTPRELQQTIKVTGPLAPSVSAELSSQAGGKVEAVNAKPGDAVSEGDVLVTVDTENLTLQLRQIRSTAEATRANLEQSQSQLERTEELSRRGIASPSSVEQAQSGVAALRANLAALESQVAAAEIALKNATVIAPFSGIVASRSVEPGQIIGAGSTLMSIVDLSVMQMNGNASIGSGAVIEPGQTVNVDVDGITGRSFVGTVDRINPVATSGTRTIPVYILIDNDAQILRGGMFATGRIVVDDRQAAFAVPTEAVREDADGSYLLGIKDGVLARFDVETGATWNAGSLIEIVSGVAEGDRIVTAPLAELKIGDKIEIVGE